MAVDTRISIILALCLLAGVGGCAFNKKAVDDRPPLTQEQADWWEANRHRATYVSGRGYYVEGTSGFFDDKGRKLSSDAVHGGMAQEDSEKGFLDRMSPKANWGKFMVMIGKGPDEKIARAAMAEGDDLFRQKQYAKAADKYKVAYKRWPDSPLEEEAIFKAGESHFFSDQYSKADDDYALLMKKYNSSQYVGQVGIRRFAIGRYWEQYDAVHPHWPTTPNFVDKTRPRFDTGGHSIRVYEKMRLDDPTGPLADDSLMAVANLHFVKGHWEQADYNYGLLRTEYPKSEHQFQAHLLGLRCKLLRYQGPGYEGAPLDEAEELATQLLTQFSHELAAERERVVQVRAGIRQQRALREYELAEYYAKGKHFGAAKIYYAKVTKEYPETQLAQQSQGKIDEYKTLPDNPKDPFQWVADILPASKKNGPVIPKPASNIATDPNRNPVR